MTGSSPVTRLLHEWRDGDRAALDRLIPLVYSELQRMAAAYLRREPEGLTLQPTALVHEAWIRMAGDNHPDFHDRAHFLGVAARLMRQILVDRARSRNATKRDGGNRIPLDDDIAFTGRRAALLIALDDAIEELKEQDPGKARILELKFFGGLTAEESAAVLGATVNQVKHQMRLAQAWLRRELSFSPEISAEP